MGRGGETERVTQRDVAAPGVGCWPFSPLPASPCLRVLTVLRVDFPALEEFSYQTGIPNQTIKPELLHQHCRFPSSSIRTRTLFCGSWYVIGSRKPILTGRLFFFFHSFEYNGWRCGGCKRERFGRPLQIPRMAHLGVACARPDVAWKQHSRQEQEQANEAFSFAE